VEDEPRQVATLQEVIEPNSGWFVEPDKVRMAIDLSTVDPNAAPQWIEIKKELTYAESQALRSAGLKSMKRNADDESTEIGIDYARFDQAKLEMWLVEWSLRDRNDKPVKLNRFSIDHMRPEVADVILAAIDEHIEDRERLKKAMSTSNG